MALTTRVLGYLGDNRRIQAVVRSWPDVRLPSPTWRNDVKERRAVLARWAALAAVPVFELKGYVNRLFDTGILRIDGTVDPAAELYVLHADLERAPLAVRRRLLERIGLAEEKAKAEAATGGAG